MFIPVCWKTWNMCASATVRRLQPRLYLECYTAIEYISISDYIITEKIRKTVSILLFRDMRSFFVWISPSLTLEYSFIMYKLHLWWQCKIYTIHYILYSNLLFPKSKLKSNLDVNYPKWSYTLREDHHYCLEFSKHQLGNCWPLLTSAHG